MTDRSSGAQAPFGVGGIISESFSLLFRRFGVFFILAFVPTLLSTVITVAYSGTAFFTGTQDPEQALEMFTDPVGIVLTFILPMIIYGVSTALIVCAAYDAKLGRPARLGQYFSIALARAIPILLVSIVLGLVVGIGFMLLVLPGLYLAAMFSVALVAVVLESKGFGALGRSKELTKGYRWPILGTIVILYIAVFLLQVVLGVVSAVIFNISTVLGILVNSAIFGIGTALISIGFVLIYARLRALKEGVGVDTLADVFS